MPLMKHADFHAIAKTQPTKKVHEITPAVGSIVIPSGAWMSEKVGAGTPVAGR